MPCREHPRGTRARASPPPPPRRQRRCRRRRRGGRSRRFLRGEGVRRSVGEVSQPNHLIVLSEKVIRYCLGLHKMVQTYLPPTRRSIAWVCTHRSKTLSLWQMRILIESAQQCRSAYKYRQYTDESNVQRTHFPYLHDLSTAFTTSSIYRFLPL